MITNGAELFAKIQSGDEQQATEIIEAIVNLVEATISAHKASGFGLDHSIIEIPIFMPPDNGGVFNLATARIQNYYREAGWTAEFRQVEISQGNDRLILFLEVKNS